MYNVYRISNKPEKYVNDDGAHKTNTCANIAFVRDHARFERREES